MKILMGSNLVTIDSARKEIWLQDFAGFTADYDEIYNNIPEEIYEAAETAERDGWELHRTSEDI